MSAGVSYAPILKKEDGRIDWKLPAQQIYNRMRGFTPWPGAYTTFRGQTCHLWGRPGSAAEARMPGNPGEIIEYKVDSRLAGLKVACGEGTILELEFVQIEGRKKTSALEFARGARFGLAEHFD